jgi:hypothetical protein
MPTAEDRAFDLVNGFRASNLVRTAALLRIPDLVHDGVSSAKDLAARVGVLEDPLGRMLRALAALGVLEEEPGGHFVLTDVGERFRDVPGSLRMVAIMNPAEAQAAFQEMLHSLRTGEPAYKKVHGVTRWEHMAADQEIADVFQRTMVVTSEIVAPRVVKAFDFGGCRVVADIGGGMGALLAGVVSAHPDMHGILFDLPSGLAGASKYLTEKGVADRCQLVPGNFFDGVPANADAYLMKFILHDWSDGDCLRILSNCRSAMPADASLLIVERVLPQRASHAALRPFMLDMQMLVVLGGRERTVEEYEGLLNEAGFSLDNVTELGDTFWLLCARPSG